MALRCEICGKLPQAGNRVSHSKRHTKRRWLPNLHSIVLQEGGSVRRTKVCTRCVRTLNKT